MSKSETLEEKLEKLENREKIHNQEIGSIFRLLTNTVQKTTSLQHEINDLLNRVWWHEALLVVLVAVIISVPIGLLLSKRL